jgi:hypothetical protein
MATDHQRRQEAARRRARILRNREAMADQLTQRGYAVTTDEAERERIYRASAAAVLGLKPRRSLRWKRPFSRG